MDFLYLCISYSAYANFYKALNHEHGISLDTYGKHFCTINRDSKNIPDIPTSKILGWYSKIVDWKTWNIGRKSWILERNPVYQPKFQVSRR